jgi:hypothetical protein
VVIHRIGQVFATCGLVFLLAADAALMAARQAGAPPDRRPAPRLFPEFEGTWVLDEQASTGRVSATPGATVTFAITPTEITLTRTPKLPEQQGNPARGSLPFVHVFRLDGTETSTDTPYPYPRGRFQLVSDALVFTTITVPRDDNFDTVTDAYSIDGDRLIARRQIVAIRAPGYIATMQEPTNNRFHHYVYRRAPIAAGR